MNSEVIVVSNNRSLNVTLFSQAAPKKPAFVEKKIGGAKNGGTRMVPTKKAVNDYPTVDP